MDIKQLSLSNFAHENIIQREFYYGSIDGMAEIIGYQIVFFKDHENPSETSVITIDSVNTHEYLIEIGNDILENLKFSFRFGDHKAKIIKLFGQPLYIDAVLAPIKRYYYQPDKAYLLGIAIDEQNYVCSVEIITNKKIIQERLEYLNEIQ